MEIKNVTEFRNFIRSNNLNGINGLIDQTTTCVDEYEHGCNCWKAKERQNIYNRCRVNYENAVGVSMGLKTRFLQCTSDSMITFFSDGRVIGVMRR